MTRIVHIVVVLTMVTMLLTAEEQSLQTTYFTFEFSTDHDRGDGGIWLYGCNGVRSDAANRKSYDQAVLNGDSDRL